MSLGSDDHLKLLFPQNAESPTFSIKGDGPQPAIGRRLEELPMWT